MTRFGCARIFDARPDYHAPARSRGGRHRIVLFVHLLTALFWLGALAPRGRPGTGASITAAGHRPDRPCYVRSPVLFAYLLTAYLWLGTLSLASGLMHGSRLWAVRQPAAVT